MEGVGGRGQSRRMLARLAISTVHVLQNKILGIKFIISFIRMDY